MFNFLLIDCQIFTSDDHVVSSSKKELKANKEGNYLIRYYGLLHRKDDEASKEKQYLRAVLRADDCKDLYIAFHGIGFYRGAMPTILKRRKKEAEEKEKSCKTFKESTGVDFSQFSEE